MTTSPSARLLSLLSLLQARRDWPGDTLAHRLDVSPRTVRRDVDRLRDLGYPVRSTRGRDGGYRLDAGTAMPPLLLDDDQAVALTVALRTASTGIAGVDEAALRALVTLGQVLPARLRARVEALEVTAVPRATDAPAVDQDVLLAVGRAVHAHEVLRFDYHRADADGAPERRRTEPHHVVTWGGRWYLVAWDLDRGDWRTFRLDRMSPVVPTGPRFTPRELPAADVGAYLGERFRSPSWPCTGEALLEAPAHHVARWVGRGAVVEPLGPDRCRVVMGAWSWVGLAATLGMFRCELTVVGPRELVEAADELAQRYARAVAGAPPSGAA
ncbi:helix-turn-helix transcriptional regulator [Cellulomonas carbonis]|uniref:Transcriptional regulator n=1 Tax=Cellulomonas carbonis T26 TaxID=947969 RepID=A0A0A0BTI9_9CELL|nr:transcriptional regulator [Cellulomonas carbonis]KGM10499.1 transcriptional regulator [Cellulomonas carbonis T26]GGC03316.1 DeoR family transcriptional regulator [Cellulomonas carbonis]